jgi:hypothetical protein
VWWRGFIGASKSVAYPSFRLIAIDADDKSLPDLGAHAGTSEGNGPSELPSIAASSPQTLRIHGAHDLEPKTLQAGSRRRHAGHRGQILLGSNQPSCFPQTIRPKVMVMIIGPFRLHMGIWCLNGFLNKPSQAGPFRTAEHRHGCFALTRARIAIS